MPAEKFKSAYKHEHKIYSPNGSPIENEYSYKIDSFGRKILHKSGETNLYEKIQASLEDTKIENIIKRAVAGDTSMLRPDGIYADLTEMPNNLIEARQAIQELENTWYGLSQKLRNKYNNSVEDFIAASGTETWLKDMGLIKEKPAEKIVETTTTEEGATTNE